MREDTFAADAADAETLGCFDLAFALSTTSPSWPFPFACLGFLFFFSFSEFASLIPSGFASESDDDDDDDEAGPATTSDAILTLFS